MAETFAQYLDRWLKHATGRGASNPLVKMPLKRFRILTPGEFTSLRDGGVFTVGTSSDPIARNLLKNYETLIRERGEHAGFLGYGVIEMVIAASTDSMAKEGILPVCLKRAALVKVGEFIKVRVDDEEEWFLNPLLNLHLPDLGGKDFTQQVQNPESFVSWLRAQLGNRVRALRSDGFVGLFSSQQMVIQGRFKDSRLRQALARNPAIQAKLGGALEQQMPPGETTDEGIEDLGMVLPCDDSQLRIVQRANFGSSLIVEGPPGTGKTQTISNIIGNALWRGENVLFVCEKRTAVAQVEERLVDSGLSGALLNLHDEDLDKAEFLRQATVPVFPQPTHVRRERPQFEELADLRSTLNDRVRQGRKTSHASTLVENREAMAGLLRLRAELGDVPKLAIDNWQSLSRIRLNKLLGIIAGWEQLAAVLANSTSVWNRIRPEAFDGLPGAARECEAWARETLSLLAQAEDIREQCAAVGLDDALLSRAVVVKVLALAEVVNRRPACHPLVIGNRSVCVAELKELREAERRRDFIVAQRHPIPLDKPLAEGVRKDGLLLLEDEKVETWRELRESRDSHAKQAEEMESLEADYAQLCRQIGVIASPFAKVRLAQLRAVIELAESECHLPRAWWRVDHAPSLAVGGWKKQLHECFSHVRSGPHPIHFSALNGLAQTHWTHLEAMAENSFNWVSYCLRFVNDRKCKFALKQIYPAVAAPKPEEWERLATHAMAARRMAQSLEESAKTHTILIQITIDYLATAHHAEEPPSGGAFTAVERAAGLVEKWRNRNDWFEVEGPHWQAAWESANPRSLTEAQRLLTAHEELRFERGRDDDVARLANSHRLAAERIDRFLTEVSLTPGDHDLAVEGSFGTHEEYGRCGEKLRALEKYKPLLSVWEKAVPWDSLDEILRWRDDFERLRGERRLDLDSRKWSQVENVLRAHGAAVLDAEKTSGLYFTLNADVAFASYAAFVAVLEEILAGLTMQPVWLEKKSWSARLSAYPELTTLWKKLTAGSVPVVHAHRLFCFNLLLNCAPDAKPSGMELAQTIRSFKEKDELLASWTVEELKGRLQERFEDARNRYTSEYARLSALLGMQRRPPVRQMVNNVERHRFADYLLAAKPCWMMSPVSLANLLASSVFDEHGVPFDMIVFDEASQIQVLNGLLAMAFGRQTIIVGDTKQLPPTNFFRSFGDDGSDDDDFGLSESLLNEYSGAIPGEMLRSHYRSETPDLIRFSNDWFYGGKLEFYPPAKVSGIGRRLVMVPDAIYAEIAGQRNNPAEARTVARLIEEHVRTSPEKSLGVVTMNMPQLELVEDLLLEASAAVRAFCSDEKRFFLRNLETVQGDEMDRIILSLTYGRNKDRAPFNAAILGPLTKSGGERRLNVAITRSKQGMTVVSSLTSADLAGSGAQSEGFRCLKAFIEDLERSEGARDFGLNGRRFERRMDGVSNVIHCESPFEERVVEFLENEGYELECQYGSGEFRIDIVVRENGRNLLAIECDGKAYHSSLVARTRDRAREAVLRQRGWRIHRVWSTNWWNFEEQEKQSIRDQIAAARTALKNEPKEQKPRESHSSGGVRFVPRSEVPRDPEVGRNPRSDGDNYFKFS